MPANVFSGKGQTTSNILRDGISVKGRMASFCITGCLAMLLTSKMLDSFGDVKDLEQQNFVSPELGRTVTDKAVESITLGWWWICQYPEDQSSLRLVNTSFVCLNFALPVTHQQYDHAVKGNMNHND